MKKQQPDRPEQKAKKDREERMRLRLFIIIIYLLVRENTFNLCLVWNKVKIVSLVLDIKIFIEDQYMI